MNIIIKNANIVLEDKVVVGEIAIKNNIISEIGTRVQPFTKNTHDAKNNLIAPGLFEMHIHGQAGISLEDMTSAKELQIFHQSLKKNGVNTYLPTFACNEPAILRCLDFYKQLNLIDKIPGFYIEGPYISAQKKGALNSDFIKNPKTQLHYIEELLLKTNGKIKMMTFAPELDGSKALVDFMLKNKIIPSIGHTFGTYNDTKQFSHINKLNITHLFNAMTPIQHRDSGIAITPFLNRNIFFELITDGIHIDNDVIKMSYQNLNKEKMIIISDSASAAGCPYGEYKHLGKEVVSNKNGVFYKSDHIFVGGNYTINQCIKNFIKTTKAEVHTAIKMATLNPAKLLGLEKKHGSIEVGKKADLILLDKGINCLHNFTC